MSKTAWVFPGQGSQFVGMGKALAETYPVVKETFEEADDVLGMDMTGLCFNGPDSSLTQTSNTQPALLTVSVATARLLKSLGLTPQAGAGHSLGEYSALAVSGAMSFSDALQTVSLRGKLMEEAAPEGTMAAILGLDRDQVEKLCRETEGIAEPATYNAPGQIVIAGEVSAVSAVKEKAEAAGARRVTMLNVSGPFHSSLLQQAGDRLAEHLKNVTINMPEFPVISNVTAKEYTSVEDIRTCLARQVSEPVMWEDSVNFLATLGIDRIVEVGPGRVLQGLVKRINRQIKTSGVLEPKDIDGLTDKE